MRCLTIVFPPLALTVSGSSGIVGNSAVLSCILSEWFLFLFGHVLGLGGQQGEDGMATMSHCRASQGSSWSRLQ